MTNSVNLDVTSLALAPSTPGTGEFQTHINASPRRMISLGLSEAFHNKRLRQGYTERAFGNSFLPTTTTPAVLCGRILAGQAWTPGYFSGQSRKNETFRFAELVALDADSGLSVAVALQHPLICQYALLVHPSASSSAALYKTRVVFVLSERVEGAERWRALVAALIRELKLKIDPASIKPAQLYYGSTNQIEAPYINLDAVLPVGLLGELTYDSALEEMLRATAPKMPTIRISGDLADRKAAAYVDRALAKLASASPGERHELLVRQSYWLVGLQKGGWPVGDVQSALRQTALGVMGEQRAGEIERVLAWAECTVSPSPLELPAARLAEQRSTTRTVAPRPCPAPETGQAPAKQACVKKPVAPTEPLHLWQAAPFMICCPEYVLIQLYVLHAQTDGFTTAQQAASAEVSIDTAQRWIDAALSWQAVSRRSAELKSKGATKEPNVFKTAERQSRRGASVARLYDLTPDLASPTFARLLPDYVQELMGRGEPGGIRQDEAVSAGLDESASALLEAITEEVSHTVEASEVSANAERAAVEKAREIMRLAESDETPFRPDKLPRRVSQLRALMIEALHATQPDRPWLHSEFMWVAGVQRGSVSAVVKLSQLMPSDKPMFRDVQLTGGDLHRAVRACCSKHHGAAVAWLDAKGHVLGHFSHVVPRGTTGVRLNLGKTYTRRDKAEAIAQTVDQGIARLTRRWRSKTVPSPDQAAQKQARRSVMPRLRGCMEARGWRFVPGPYGYWVRGDQVQPNTWAALVEALLLDSEWAREQRERRMRDEIGGEFFDVAKSLGAEVTKLA